MSRIIKGMLNELRVKNKYQVNTQHILETILDRLREYEEYSDIPSIVVE